MTIHPGRRFALSRTPGLRGLVRRLWAREDPDVCVFLACVHPGDVVLDVGARLNGQASFFTFTRSTMSLWRARLDLACEVMEMIVTSNRLMAGRT